jgi:hypothetical protein
MGRLFEEREDHVGPKTNRGEVDSYAQKNFSNGVEPTNWLIPFFSIGFYFPLPLLPTVQRAATQSAAISGSVGVAVSTAISTSTGAASEG